MDVIVDDDTQLRPVRAALCDSQHDRPVLAVARVRVRGTPIDCCPACLTVAHRLAQGFRVPLEVEPHVSVVP